MQIEKVSIMLCRTALAIATLALSTGAASACSCALVSRAESIAQSKVAFVGLVQSTRAEAGDRQRATVRVTETIKGDVPATMQVTTGTISSACGYPMQAGRAYRFAGEPKPDGQLEVNLCVMFALNRPE